jgi:type I restriction enzyme S subunit
MMTLLDIVEKWISGDWGKESPCEDAQNQICCIRGADIVPIANVDFNDIPMRFVSERSLANRSLKEGDIVIEKSGGSPTQSTGRVAFVSEELIDAKGPILCSNFCSAFRVRSGWNPKYIYYYLQYFYGLGTFFNFEGKTSGLKNLDVENAFTAIVVPSASKNEQDKVEEILSTIDRKIALNRKRIATLEAMAKEIYDYWFVQFDFPDAHGRPYKSSGGAMVYNPDLKREIPKGWEVGCLADIALYPKETVRSDAIDINHYVTTDSLLQGKKGRAQAENLPPVPVSLVAFQKADTLVANIRPYLKKLWYASESGGCSQDVLVFRPICSELAPLVHSILWQDAFFDYVMAAAKGSKMPRGDKAHILAYPISLPDNKVARRFGETVEKFYAWRECALKESELLSSLRDFLLPLLMNGQVKVG